MKVSELGEFGLIELIASIIPPREAGYQLLVGIGDDAAAWQSSDSATLATTDTMVQGVHFTSESTWKELGWKALAINLSDIAAMGGQPQYALISLTLPGDVEVESVIQLYQGMMEVANHFEVVITGGNISSSPLVVITVTLIGQAQRNSILTRSAAKPGDLIAVTGYLGASAAGLKMLTQNLQFDSATMAFLRKAHLQPHPRVLEGQMLSHYGVQAAIDISDGLVADLTHLCKASKVGARIEIDKLPVHPMVRSAFPHDSLDLALSGGEDYELLFTASEQTIDRVKKEIDCPITPIGDIVEEGAGQVKLIDKQGHPLHRDKEGWEHFISRDY
jgi:thiamine-monophosphate kinase